MRETLNFVAEGAVLAASLDPAPGTTGVVIVSGGNEIRCGPHGSMAMLAARLAAAGHPVLRFDRRGVGDSVGDNGGYRTSRPDIAAAIAALRAAQPQLRRVVGFGNCDGAAALLIHQPLALDALVLANPWTLPDAADGGEAVDAAPALPPAAAIRARYLTRLRDPASIWRLLTGGVDLARLARGLRAAAAQPLAQPVATDISSAMLAALAAQRQPTAILLASGDRTAQAFAASWASAAGAAARANPAVKLHERASASHSFASDGDADWLAAQLIAAAGSA